MAYPYLLPPLPYSYDALEPHIDAWTMEIHHDKHQLAYVDKLNDALSKWPEGQPVPLEDLLKDPGRIPEHVRTAIINNGGGNWIHTMFWEIMKPDSSGEPSGELRTAINEDFGDFNIFKERFSKDAALFFGSGWTWLAISPSGTLAVISTPNHNLPQVDGFRPILVLDLWEHAYYLKYQNRRPEYIEAWWNVVNWPAVEERYKTMR